MKNKITIIIVSSLFILTIVLSAIFIKRVYINKIKPVNKKILVYKKLQNKLNNSKEKLQKEINNSKSIQKIDKENQNKKDKLEKKLNEYEIKYNSKVIYLTFDDGPSNNTNTILNILDKYNVKATFFVTCTSYLEELSKQIVKRGHTIGLHTCSHEYSYIYSSLDNYFSDLNEISNLVEKYTGIKSKYVRFPGGSSNTISKNYNKGIISIISKSLKEKGYKYYDWNIDSKDTSYINSGEEHKNVIELLKNNDRDINIILMHDTKDSTRDSLESIIKDALDLGYSFSNINEYTKEMHHSINN